MNLELADACKIDVYTCLWHVYMVIDYRGTVAESIRAEHAATWQINDTLKAMVVYAPFGHSRARFRYRTTASYYLCWYTMRQDPLLRRFGGPCTDRGGSDYRMFDGDDFGCARFSFCPDPCCGTYQWTGYVSSVTACRTWPDNPCHGLGSGQCDILRENTNFEDLIRNRINISCPCKNARGSGFVYSRRFRECIDIDECYEGKHSCPSSEACRNTIGGFTCVCAAGFDFVNGTCRPWGTDPK
ncbi:hypothetical protein LSAT2_016658 [Lamellibrachia satsuma]|nr:hypothetical protein LSAT2_016658 [Lamellibrachia satsuma]